MDQSRSALLLSKDKLEKIENLSILIFGLGGVGGLAFEGLVRHGIKHFCLVDFDVINASNLNRQVLYTQDDVDQYKVDVAKARAIKINPELDITVLKEKFGNSTKIDFSKFDFIIDCIDDLDAKVLIIKESLEEGIPFITSLGMGNRLDPSKVNVVSLNKTSDDPLAKKLRYKLRELNINLKDVPCVFSSEIPIRKEIPVGSTFVVPNIAGIHICSYTINYFLKEAQK